jgi:hypothetical protein
VSHCVLGLWDWRKRQIQDRTQYNLLGTQGQKHCPGQQQRQWTPTVWFRKVGVIYALGQKWLHSHWNVPGLFQVNIKQLGTKCPTTAEWIKKVWYIYTMEYYSAIKKEWGYAVCRKMEGTGDHNNEWNKSSSKAKYHIKYVFAHT